MSPATGVRFRPRTRENERSLKYGFRVVSSYSVGGRGERVWIITEADRSSTCLLPTEY